MTFFELTAFLLPLAYAYGAYSVADGQPVGTRLAVAFTAGAAWVACWIGPDALGRRISLKLRVRGARLGLAVPGDPWVARSVSFTSWTLLLIGLIQFSQGTPGECIVWHLSIGATVIELCRVVDRLWTRWFVSAIRSTRGWQSSRTFPAWLAHARAIALATPMTVAAIAVVIALVRVCGWVP